MIETYNPSTMNLTEGAVDKILALSKEEEVNLRVYVTGGGCSGFQYGFSFDHEIDARNLVIIHKNVLILILNHWLEARTDPCNEYHGSII